MSAPRRLSLLDPRRSLRARHAWVLGISGLVFALVASLAIERHERAQVEANAGQLARREAQLVGRTLRHEWQTHLQALRELAGHPDVAGMANNAEMARERLEQLRASQPEYAWLGLADEDGRIRVATGALRQDADAASERWVVLGRRGPWIGERHDGRPWADAFPATRDGRRPAFVELAVPLHDAAGQPAGVLGAWIAWEWLEQVHAAVTDDPAHDGSRQSLIVGSDGRVAIGPAALLGQRLEAAPLQQLLRDGGAAVVEWPDGGRWLTAAAAPPEGDGPEGPTGAARFTTLVRQPADIALASAEVLRRGLLAGGLLATAAFVALSLVVAGRVVAPVQALAVAAARRGEIGAGAGPGAPGVSGVFGGRAAARHDEVGALARALDHMDRELVRQEASRQAAATALAQSEARFQLALRGADAGLWEWELATDGLYVSPSFPPLMGCAAETAPTRAAEWAAMLHPDDRERTVRALGDLATGRRDRVEGEVTVPGRDGAPERRVLMRAFLVRDGQHRPARVIGTGIDVSERWQAQRQLREREAMLGTTSRIAHIGGMVLDLRSGEASWTDEAARLHDLEPGPIPAAVLELRYFDEEPRRRIGAAAAAARDDGTPYDLELPLTTPRGRKWVRVIGLPEREDGRTARVFVVLQDITARRQAEDEVRRLNAELEQRVAERTAQLRAANAELDSFAYAVSHDLRAPLRAMAGFSQALIEDHGERLDDDARAYLDQITSASRRMGALIDGLLTLSRSTRGELRRDAVDVSTLAQRCLAELRSAEPDRRIDCDVAPNLCVHGDARMVDVVLRNLLGNAWKYTARTAEARLSVTQRWQDGRRWIAVEDNGAGFDMAHAGRLFKAFQRLHRQDEFPGLGIGLATVQRIVQRHGGELRAEAQPGHGARFSFTLPDPLPGDPA